MINTEIVEVLTIISGAYSNKFKYPTGDDVDDDILESAWMEFLEDYPLEVVTTALKKLIINQPTWPPTVGELVQEIEKLRMSEEDEITGPEAWQMTLDAIGRYSALYNPKKVLESLPERVKKTAQVVGLTKIALNSEADTFLRNSFIQTYEQIQQHDFERKMLPDSIRADIDKIKRPETKKLADKFTGVIQLESGEKEAG